MAKSGVQKTMEILIAIEKVADEVLVNKRELTEYGKQKEDLRVALKEIEKSNDQKVWITIGSMPIKMEKEKAVELLKKGMYLLQIKVQHIIKLLIKFQFS